MVDFKNTYIMIQYHEKETPTKPITKPGTKPAPTPIRRDRPSVNPKPKA